MTKLDLSAAKALCEKASGGEWHVQPHSHWRTGVEVYAVHSKSMQLAECGTGADDAAFIAAARTLVPQLIAEVERLTSEQRLNGEISANVNDAINRAGIHCALYYWEAIDQIAADRDALRSQLASALSAKDEACRIAERVIADSQVLPSTDSDRIHQLAAIGREGEGK